MNTQAARDFQPEMKAIIDGKTYDTATATVLAVKDYVGVRNEKLRDVLYVTRRGAFFEWSNAYYDEAFKNPRRGYAVGGWRKGPEGIRALSVEEASAWAEKNEATLTDDYQRYFGELPPEAGSEEVAMTVRLQLSLKSKAEQAARAKGESLNGYIVRIIEEAVR